MYGTEGKDKEWRIEYNERCLHISLGERTPEEYARMAMSKCWDNHFMTGIV